MPRSGIRRLGSCGGSAAGKVNGFIRATATGVVGQNLQEKSYYAARINLDERERPHFAPPTADTRLAQGKVSSLQPVKGQLPYLLGVGPSKAFVSKAFVPFGASQKSIGDALGISDRTVRRHQKLLGIEKRQLVQAKAAYGRVQLAIEHEASYLEAEPGIWYQQSGNDIKLFEPNGVSSSRRAGGHAIASSRLFRYQGKTWIYRCNLYATTFKLTSMKAARKAYKAVPVPVSADDDRRVVGDDLNRTPDLPG